MNLAASITEPNQQSWAYRLIAEALADVKPEKAKQVLELAAHSLDSDRNSAMGLHISTTMGGLLPVYEKLAPEKMRSLIWQTVYLAQPKSRWNDNGPTPLTHIQNAAATISRYDRQLANALDIGEQEVPRNFDPTRSATNFITLKPEQLTEFLKDLEEQRTSNALRPRETVIEMLMGTDAEFWAAVSKPSFLQYLSDRFEEH